MKIRRAFAASATGLVLTGGLASSASAATSTTWAAATFVAGQIVSSPAVYQNMNRSIAQAPSNRNLGVAAHTSNGSIYGSWVYASGYMCHAYAPNSLGGMIWNGSSGSMKMYGIVVQNATDPC